MAITHADSYTSRPYLYRQSLVRRDARKLAVTGVLLGTLTFIAIVFLMPLFFMITTALKTPEQLANNNMLPMSVATWQYEGKSLGMYNVPIDGQVKQLALVSSTRSKSVFLNPADPTAPAIELPIRKAELTPVMRFDPDYSNFQKALAWVDLPVVMRNTLAITILGGLGAILSGALIAYGFSRYHIPGAGILFMLLMATIILPPQVTILPLFALFQKLGWIGTVIPLIVPHFFGNAYNVFLLRQYFMTIPIEMDEAAKVDGATPFQTFFRIILPQSKGALLIVGLFHFVYAWGEFYQAMIFTSGNKNAYPLSVVLQNFQVTFLNQTNIAMAGCLLAIIAPVVIFLMAQRAFVKNIVITGVEK